MSGKSKHLHFLGITGHAMRGLALAARELGYRVTGSDPGAKPPGTTWLEAQGIPWYDRADPKHLKGVDMVVMSGGTPIDDPELLAAQQQNIPIQPYAAFVGELAATKRRIVVAGTHGKTTTTALITWLLESAGHHPDYLIGIQPQNFSSSVRLGDAPVMVLEGDEYKASSIDLTSKFVYYRPDVLVLTSLEMDHPDLFKSLDEIAERFRTLVNALPKRGRVLYWAGTPALKPVVTGTRAVADSYGEGGVWHADHLDFNPTGLAFDLYERDVYRGHLRLPLYGRHNVENGVAAAAVALGEGLSFEEIERGCETFLGAARRFSNVSAPGSAVRVIDDYAHHPTEIATTIQAARLHFGGRVIAVAQPHTYSRTQELLAEYREAVATADVAFVAEIEGAREAHLAHTVSGEQIARNIPHVIYEPDRTKLAQRIIHQARPGDTIICMTVGGAQQLAEELATALKTR